MNTSQTDFNSDQFDTPTNYVPEKIMQKRNNQGNLEKKQGMVRTYSDENDIGLYQDKEQGRYMSQANTVHSPNANK